jgi:hypothetical protein
MQNAASAAAENIFRTLITHVSVSFRQYPREGDECQENSESAFALKARANPQYNSGIPDEE